MDDIQRHDSREVYWWSIICSSSKWRSRIKGRKETRVLQVSFVCSGSVGLGWQFPLKISNFAGSFDDDGKLMVPYWTRYFRKILGTGWNNGLCLALTLVPGLRRVLIFEVDARSHWSRCGVELQVIQILASILDVVASIHIRFKRFTELGFLFQPMEFKMIKWSNCWKLL